MLIFDAPSTGLDPDQILEICWLVRALGRDKTVFFSMYIFSELEVVCDRVLLLDAHVE
ncbi:MAG: hypothetical protein ABI045_04005 [Flavobacteriales bacterium]